LDRFGFFAGALARGAGRVTAPVQVTGSYRWLGR
jgi:hypothetical protein